MQLARGGILAHVGPSKTDDAGWRVSDVDDEAAEPEGSSRVYDELLGAAKPLGQLGEFLRSRAQTRSHRLLESYLRLTPFLAAFAQEAHLLDWLLGFADLPSDIVDLAQYAKGTTFSGVEALLSGDDDAASNQGRLLMEVEFLLRDFAADPRRVQKWAGLEPFERSRQFSFGEVRKRVEQRHGIPKGFSFPDRAEYQVHSRTAHPSPPDPRGEAPDLATDLFFGMGDLLTHFDRVIVALVEFAEVVADPTDQRDVPDPPEHGALDRARADIGEYMSRLPGVTPGREPIPMNWAEDARSRVVRAHRRTGSAPPHEPAD